MGNKLSPISQFLDRFLQGVQVYQSFQEMENRRRQTGINQQRLDIEQKKFVEAQRRQAILEDFAKGLEKGTTRTTQIPGAEPTDITPTLAPPPYGRQPAGYSIDLGARFAPETGLAPMDITTQVPPTDEQKMRAAAVRFGGSPAILQMLKDRAATIGAMQPRRRNWPGLPAEP